MRSHCSSVSRIIQHLYRIDSSRRNFEIGSRKVSHSLLKSLKEPGASQHQRKFVDLMVNAPTFCSVPEANLALSRVGASEYRPSQTERDKIWVCSRSAASFVSSNSGPRLDRTRIRRRSTLRPDNRSSWWMVPGS